MTRRKKAVIVAAVALIITCLFVGRLTGRGVPFVGKKWEWSIGIYTGDSPFKLTAPENISNPVLTAKDVTDVEADFLADPFILYEDQNWYMFFEVMNTHTAQGDIGLATSDDGLHWAYKQIVLNEPFWLSYPYVFKWENEHYMVPCQTVGSVRLYKAVSFPTQWCLVKTLLIGDYADPSIFRYEGKWWLFVGTNTKRNDTLRLYYASDLLGPWTEHSESPIVNGNASMARPGGRVLVFDGRVVRFAQDDSVSYGNNVRAFEITRLTTTDYEEKEVGEEPILKPSGRGWNADGMHTIAPWQVGEKSWIACVDGYKRVLVFGFGY
jgi:hypothetical protein